MNKPDDESMAETEFGDIVAAWRRATGAPVAENRQTAFRAYRRRLDRGWTWVLEHHGEVIEMTDSIDVLLADHPDAHIDVVDPPSADSPES